MKKVTPIKKLKKKAWALQSEWIRRKEDGVCFTCGKKLPWKEQQSGHFVHGDSLDFDLRNIHCQCVRCNHWLSGNLIPYTRKMLALYGEDVVDELHAKKHELILPTALLRKKLEGMICDYENKLEAINQRDRANAY